MPTPSAQPFDEQEWQQGAQGAPRFEFEEVTGDEPAAPFDARAYDAPPRSEFDGFDDRDPSASQRAAGAGPRADRGPQRARRPRGGFESPFREAPSWDGAAAIAGSSDSRMWASIGHAAGAAGVLITGGTIGWLAPLLIWLTRRDYDPFAAEQAKEALNFQITTVILSVVFGILSIILIGIPFLLAVILGNIVFSIVGAIKTHQGEAYSYPYNFRFIR